jgi:hypothetical protein
MIGGVGVSIYSTSAAVNSIDFSGRKVFVGGVFARAGNISASSIAQWDDEKEVWSAMGAGVNGVVHSVFANGEKDVWVAGAFTVAGGVPTPAGVARWDGEKWSAPKCETCKIKCDEKLSYLCLTTGVGYEIKNVKGKMVLRHETNLYYYDGTYFRQYPNFPGLSGAQVGSQLMTRSATDAKPGFDLWVASPARTLSDINTNGLTEFNFETSNEAGDLAGGFSGTVYAMSSGSALVPSLFAALMLVLALIA